MNEINFLKATVVNTFLTYLHNPSTSSILKYISPSVVSPDACHGPNGELAKAIYDDITENADSNEKIKESIALLDKEWTPEYVLNILNRNRRMSPYSMDDIKNAEEAGLDILSFHSTPDFSASPISRHSDASSTAGLRII